MRNVIFVVLMVVIGALFVGTAVYFASPAGNVMDGQVIRDLSIVDVMVMKKEPQRELAWDSEITYPLLKYDLAYAEKKGYDIVYVYEGSRICFRFEDGAWFVRGESPYTSYPTFGNELTNFSIYKSGKDIVIYGYTDPHGFGNSWFRKITVGKKKYNEETIAYETDLPIKYQDATLDMTDAQGYKIGFSDGAFYFFKNGQCVNIQECPKEINSKDYISMPSKYAIIGNDLYSLSLQIENETPNIKFNYIDVISTIKKFNFRLEEIVSVDSPKIYLDIYIKDDKEWVLVPDKWESDDVHEIKKKMQEMVYSEYSLKCLNSSKFEFKYNQGSWIIRSYYDVNGIEFYGDEYLDGYDKDYTLPEEVAKKFEVTVKSEEECKEIKEKIRKEYFDYYD